MGAHVAGICGKRVTRGRVQTIVGMDAAGPLFSLNSPGERFASTDGVNTQGIVTNGGTQGFYDPLAQANFYPNSGRSQPGCGLVFFYSSL